MIHKSLSKIYHSAVGKCRKIIHNQEGRLVNCILLIFLASDVQRKDVAFRLVDGIPQGKEINSIDLHSFIV